MKTIVTAVLLALSLSACAAATPSQEYGVRNATRDYPYNPAY